MCVRLSSCLVGLNTPWDSRFHEAIESAVKSGIVVKTIENSMRNRMFVLKAVTNSQCLSNALKKLWSLSSPDTPFTMPVASDEVGAVIRNENAPNTPARRVRRVVIDGLNYLSRFVPAKSDPFYPWSSESSAERLLREARHRVRAFADGLRAANVEAIVVFDCGQTTPEANAKWTERRLNEVRCGTYEMLPASDLFVKAFLEDEGIAWLNPEGIDGDDAVVAVAHAVDGFVLSRDGDMTRYHAFPSHRVLFDFAIERGAVLFERRLHPPLEPRAPRDVPPVPIDFATNVYWRGGPGRLLERLRADPTMRRGNVDGHTARHGNLCADPTSVALRAAVYAHAGIPAVEECFPVMGARNAELRTLHTAAVAADDLLDLLRDNPAEVLRRLEAAQPATRKHACAAMVAEWHTALLGNGPVALVRAYAQLMEFADLMVVHASPVHAADTGWRAVVRCAGTLHNACGVDLFPSSVHTAAERSVERGHWLAPKCRQCIRKLVQLKDRHAWKRAFDV